MYQLKSEASFDGAHFLTDYYGKCENLHGHRWKVVAYIGQDDLLNDGTTKDMVMDFGVFKRKLREVVGEFDHMFLVEDGSLAPQTMRALEDEGFVMKVLPFRTTAENLAHYFFDTLEKRGLPMVQVDVYETPLNCASYFGPNTARS